MSNPNYQLNQEKSDVEKAQEDPVTYHNLSEPYVKQVHTWQQQGPDLICTSCPAHHGIRVGVHKRFKGFDINGNMVIENV